MSKKVLTRMFFLVLVGGLIYGGVDLAGAAGPPSIVTGTVTVANTPSSPVPVQQEGTATVNVSNTSLPVTGTVTTKSGDNPAFQPISADCGIDAVEGVAECNIYEVPAGKELVVTSVSVKATLPTGQAPQDVDFEHRVGGGDTPFFVPVSEVGSNANNATWQGGLATQFYADPGTGLSFSEVADNPSISGGMVAASIDGYLVTLPS
jgi:hypothetical protein